MSTIKYNIILSRLIKWCEKFSKLHYKIFLLDLNKKKFHYGFYNNKNIYFIDNIQSYYYKKSINNYYIYLTIFNYTNYKIIIKVNPIIYNKIKNKMPILLESINNKLKNNVYIDVNI